MSDLSKVLGDLYGGDEEPSSAAANRFRASSAPEWADESRLDAAFENWTPGPPADAPAAELEMSVVLDAPDMPLAQLDDDLAAGLSAALVHAGEENGDPEVPVASAPSYDFGDLDQPVPLPAEPVHAYVPPMLVEAPVPSRPWSRSDDDVLPGKASGNGGGKATKVREPRAPKGLKAKTPKVKEPKPAPVDGEAAPVKFFGMQLRRK
jgi:hypothetical protein